MGNTPDWYFLHLPNDILTAPEGTFDDDAQGMGFTRRKKMIDQNIKNMHAARAVITSLQMKRLSAQNEYDRQDYDIKIKKALNVMFKEFSEMHNNARSLRKFHVVKPWPFLWSESEGYVKVPPELIGTQ